MSHVTAPIATAGVWQAYGAAATEAGWRGVTNHGNAPLLAQSATAQPAANSLGGVIVQPGQNEAVRVAVGDIVYCTAIVLPQGGLTASVG